MIYLHPFCLHCDGNSMTVAWILIAITLLMILCGLVVQALMGGL